MTRIVLATRKSPLALAQAELAAARLRAAFPGAAVELLRVVTTGDRQAAWSLAERGGKGLFTAELEQALLRGEAAAAVHSCKDLPGADTPGLAVAGFLPRADPRDVLVLRAGLRAPATLATGSPRRRAQAARLFPGATFTEIRGNVDTRLKKIATDHAADGTILAAAGLARLGIAGWPGLEFRPLEFAQMTPAVGQGAIALQTRAADAAHFAAALDADTRRRVALERACQRRLGAGCQLAFGAHATDTELWFFHEQTGPRVLPLAPDDFARPEETAARLLSGLGFHD